LALLLCGGAVPALALGISEIEVTQTQIADDGIIMEATDAASIGPGGEILLPVTSVADWAVLHDTSRIAFLLPGSGGDRVAIEGLRFDCCANKVTGFLGAVQNKTGIFGATIEIFDIYVRPDGTYELAWTQAAADVLQQVFGSQGGFAAGEMFGIASLAEACGVPEPGTLVLLAGGAFGLVGFGRRRRR
jgi:hypothetical protein